jgi:phosphohistidine phosphatase
MSTLEKSNQRLAFLRHAIAEEAKPGQHDSERALVPAGREKLKKILFNLAQSGYRPDVIVSSPYKRCRQTAELASKALDVRLELSEDLIPGSSFPDFCQNNALIVGHEPELSTWIAQLLGFPESFIRLKKSGFVLLERDIDERWQLIAVLSPKWL